MCDEIYIVDDQLSLTCGADLIEAGWTVLPENYVGGHSNLSGCFCGFDIDDILEYNSIDFSYDPGTGYVIKDYHFPIEIRMNIIKRQLKSLMDRMSESYAPTSTQGSSAIVDIET